MGEITKITINTKRTLPHIITSFIPEKVTRTFSR